MPKQPEITELKSKTWIYGYKDDTGTYIVNYMLEVYKQKKETIFTLMEYENIPNSLKQFIRKRLIG